MRYEMSKIKYIWSCEKYGRWYYDICYESGRYRQSMLREQLPRTAINFILTATIKNEKHDDFFGETIVYTNR